MYCLVTAENEEHLNNWAIEVNRIAVSDSTYHCIYCIYLHSSREVYKIEI